MPGKAYENPPPKELSQSILGPPVLHSTPVSLPGTPPLPHTSPHRSPSIQTHKHTFNQRSVPQQTSSRNSDPDSPLFESSDLADEEVSHINSSVRDWGERLDSREHSESPFTSPAPSPAPLKNCSTTSLTAGREKDLKKFYSVDTRGFLAKPSWADDQRRHSIEICPSIDDGERSFFESLEDRKRLPLHIQSETEYVHGVQRKKKMSPPCISIDPPMEEDSTTPARTKASENSLLRRRTPSCESTAYRDSSELAESQPGDVAPKAERRPPPACRGEHLTIPNFSFEQSDSGSASSLSDTGQASLGSEAPRPDDTMALELKKVDHLKTQCSNPRPNPELLGGARSPLRKHSLVPAITATDEDVDEPV